MHSEVAPGNEEFQQAIRRAVPLGWVFKGYPQHHAHASVGLVRKALLEEEQVGEGWRMGGGPGGGRHMHPPPWPWPC